MSTVSNSSLLLLFWEDKVKASSFFQSAAEEVLFEFSQQSFHETVYIYKKMKKGSDLNGKKEDI